MTRVVLADPSELERRSIRHLLDDSYRIIVDSRTALPALSAIMVDQPQLFVASFSQTDIDGLTMVRRAISTREQLRIVLLTNDESRRSLIEAARAGAQGFVAKSEPLEVVKRAIDEVRAGRTFICSHNSGIMLSEVRSNTSAAGLSGREWDVLRLTYNGLSNKQIAESLALSIHSVRGYRQTLMKKLGATNGIELVRTALTLGLLSDEEGNETDRTRSPT